MKKYISVFILLLLLSLVVFGCSPETVEVTKEIIKTVEVEKEVVVTVEVEVEPEFEPPPVEIPFWDAWVNSGHADLEAEAFAHWNEEDPAEIPASCAKCHSQYGYHDFLGIDGTEAGVIDNPAEIGSTVSCVTCHNLATVAMDSVIMPSGAELTDLGAEARCMQCHQGRESSVSVNEAILEAGADEDAVSEELGFINVHYFAAAATKYGTLANGGYEYEGKSYDAEFMHVEGYSTCVDCHSPHTLEVKTESCESCHSFNVLQDIRMLGSTVDYDGDGNFNEGINFEIADLQKLLYETMQTYSLETIGTGILYDTHSYPYFFIDTNGDGEAGEDEINYGNQFASWTPRLLKAAYNYQFSLKDPGAFAHGGKYIIQLLYDSIEDLDGDVSELSRNDVGHFAGSEEAFRHWDEDGVVSAGCAKCHSAGGLPQLLTLGGIADQPISNGLMCSTCHNDLTSYTRYEVSSVTFPSGMIVSSEYADTNLCMNCHQGRESGLSIVEDLAAAEVEYLAVLEAGEGPEEDLGFLDTVSSSLRFVNVHYFAAGATLYGSEAGGAYEYDGMDYIGLNEHILYTNGCTSCHSAHKLSVKFQTCQTCHNEFASLEELKVAGIGSDIDAMLDLLYEAMQAYATETIGKGFLYDGHSYPYFFTDLNGDGELNADEANYGNAYAYWTPRLLRAAYNFQYIQKDPGAYAHNGKYIAQILVDTLADFDAVYEGFERP